jgi:predicted dehydrogenase
MKKVKMKTSLIVGMGIGNLYAKVLGELGHGVITVDSDPTKDADFTSVDDAIKECRMFDTVHICTPNFTHAKLARQVAPYTSIVFIEKPGVSTSSAWSNIVLDNPKTRFMMVKNNMWRSNISELKELASRAKVVNIEWTRKNCIPSPGSWFTTRELAFGGVSRDLMPHLLSLYIAMNPNWRNDQVNGQGAQMVWELKDIESTEYGTVNPNGIYDVDDKCNINFGNKWHCSANWRSMSYENSGIEFIMQDNTVERFDLGWCPEDAYKNMIQDAVNNLDNMDFWSEQLAQDLFIHQKIEIL